MSIKLRIFSILLALLMVFGSAPITVTAEYDYGYIELEYDESEVPSEAPKYDYQPGDEYVPDDEDCTFNDLDKSVEDGENTDVEHDLDEDEDYAVGDSDKSFDEDEDLDEEYEYEEYDEDEEKYEEEPELEEDLIFEIQPEMDLFSFRDLLFAIEQALELEEE